MRFSKRYLLAMMFVIGFSAWNAHAFSPGWARWIIALAAFPGLMPVIWSLEFNNPDE